MCSSLRINTGINTPPLQSRYERKYSTVSQITEASQRVAWNEHTHRQQWLVDGGTAIACIPLNTPNANDINIYLKIKLRCAKFSSFKYIHKIGINNDYMYIVDEYSLSMFCSTRTTMYHTLLHTRAYTRRRAYTDDVRQSTHSTVPEHTHTHAHKHQKIKKREWNVLRTLLSRRRQFWWEPTRSTFIVHPVRDGWIGSYVYRMRWDECVCVSADEWGTLRSM